MNRKVTLSPDPWVSSEALAEPHDYGNIAGAPKPLIRIKGLKPTGIEGEFELDAVVIPRSIDWQKLQEAIGRGCPDSLADRICGEIYREDLMDALRERIEL